MGKNCVSSNKLPNPFYKNKNMVREINYCYCNCPITVDCTDTLFTLNAVSDPSAMGIKRMIFKSGFKGKHDYRSKYCNAHRQIPIFYGNYVVANFAIDIGQVVASNTTVTSNWKNKGFTLLLSSKKH